MHSVSTSQVCDENGNWSNATGTDWPFPRVDLYINFYKDIDIISRSNDAMS